MELIFLSVHFTRANLNNTCLHVAIDLEFETKLYADPRPHNSSSVQFPN